MENYNKLELLKAKKRVKKIKDFYIHLLVYVCVNMFFIITTLITNPGNFWFVLPLVGWGIGLFADAANTFNFIPFLSKDWENRKIIQFMNEERNNDINKK